MGQDKIVLPDALLAKNHLLHEKLTVPLEASKDFMANLRALRESSKTPEQSRGGLQPLLPEEMLQLQHQALKIAQEVKRLEKLASKALFRGEAVQALEKYAADIAKQPDMMNYLQDNDHRLAQKIQLVKSRKLAKGVEQDIEF